MPAKFLQRIPPSLRSCPVRDQCCSNERTVGYSRIDGSGDSRFQRSPASYVSFSNCIRLVLHSVTNVGRSILRASEVTAIQIHRRGVDGRAARGDGRDCAASFCLFCRVFVCFAARCCRCSSEEQSWSGGTGWILRGYSGVLLGYCRGTTGVLLQSPQFGRTIIDPLLRIGKVPRATVGSVTVLPCGCSVSRY